MFCNPRRYALGMAVLLALVWAGRLWADQEDEKMKQMKAILEEEVKKESEALNQLSAETIDLDKQVAAIKELIMMKDDLDNLKKENKMLIENEVASAQLADAKAVILQSAEQVRTAKSNQDIEKAMQLAKEKIDELRRKLALAEHEAQTIEEAKTTTQNELAAITSFLDSVKTKYGKVLAENEKIAKQFEMLRMELAQLDAKLRTAPTIAHVREIAQAIDMVRAQIELIQRKLALLSRKDLPQHKIKQEMEKLDAQTVTPVAVTQSPEKTTLIGFLKQFKDKILRLFFNTLKYFWTDEAGGLAFVSKVILVLLALSSIATIFTLVWRKR
jgi:DNA repair exonuclease SbcCD ATPase subunit